MYKLVYGLLYAVSLLPWRVMYILSDGITFIIEHIIKYRRDVVYEKYKQCFPRKNQTADIKKLPTLFIAILLTAL